MGIRVLVADAQPMFREGLRTLLLARDIELVAEAGDGAEALERLAAARADVAVLETLLPRLSGIEVVERIRRSHPRTRCIALSDASGRLELERAMRAGAAGFVSRCSPVDELAEAVRSVAAGSRFVSPQAAGHLIEALAEPPDARSEALTEREREVLQLVAEGGSSKEIAQELGISPRTVESHRARLMKKLAIHKTASLVRYAVREGLIAPRA